MEDIDCYASLGVGRKATPTEIKKAFRKQAMKYHPDKNPGDKQAEKKFKEVNLSYKILNDPEKRAAYDQYGFSAFNQRASGFGGNSSGFSSANFDDLSSVFGDLGDIFGDFMGQSGSRRTRVPRGRDVNLEIEINLKEAFTGVKKSVNYSRVENCSKCSGSGRDKNSKVISCSTCNGRGKIRMQQSIFTVEQTCPTCRGAGEKVENPCGECHGNGLVSKTKSVDLDIPRGIDNGNQIRMRSLGDMAGKAGVAGDLNVFINIKDDEIFARRNSDLQINYPISIFDATIGCEVEVPCIDGKKMQLRVVEGSQNNTKIRLKGLGMPVLNSGGRRGDMYINLKLEVPVNLSKQQKNLIKSLRDGLVEKNNPKNTSFFKQAKSFLGSIMK